MAPTGGDFPAKVGAPKASDRMTPGGCDFTPGPGRASGLHVHPPNCGAADAP